MKQKVKNFLFYIINPNYQNLKSDTTILVEMLNYDFYTGKIYCRLMNPLSDDWELKHLNSNELI